MHPDLEKIIYVDGFAKCPFCKNENFNYINDKYGHIITKCNDYDITIFSNDNNIINMMRIISPGKFLAINDYKNKVTKLSSSSMIFPYSHHYNIIDLIPIDEDFENTIKAILLFQ